VRPVVRSVASVVTLAVLTLLITGCGGFVRARYEVIAKEDLPVDVAHWKEWTPEASQALVHKTKDSVYVAIGLGPCWRSKCQVKVTSVYRSGPRFLLKASLKEAGSTQKTPTFPVEFIRIPTDSDFEAISFEISGGHDEFRVKYEN